MPSGCEHTEPRALISWTDVSTALDEIVTLTQRTLDIFDASLALQGWAARARCDSLARAMIERRVQVRILLADSRLACRELPRLINLLATQGHRFSVMEAAEGPLPASNFVVADQQHLLFRPNSVQSRGNVNFHNVYKSTAYSRSFEVLWQQGGQRVFPEAFGL
jgi:hypothetical protein